MTDSPPTAPSPSNHAGESRNAARSTSGPAYSRVPTLSVLVGSLAAEATQLVNPQPELNDQMTSVAASAVSAINRDVVELIARQKVALNDLLEENQRLQIKYNNHVQSTDAWKQSVLLGCERELVQKTSRLRDELSVKYDEAFTERSQHFAVEAQKQRSEIEALHAALHAEKQDHVRIMSLRLQEVQCSQRTMAAMALGALVLVLGLAFVIFRQHLEFKHLQADYAALHDNHHYAFGNGLKSALVRLLKPNIPHPLRREPR